MDFVFLSFCIGVALTMVVMELLNQCENRCLECEVLRLRSQIKELEKKPEEKKMGYARVLPRDAFNESKLLKCIGQLMLKLDDKKYDHVSVVFDDPEEGFKIQQNVDGDIEVTNFHLYLKGIKIYLFHPLNRKDAYPMMFQGDDFGEVFNRNGKFSEEFERLLEA